MVFLRTLIKVDGCCFNFLKRGVVKKKFGKPLATWIKKKIIQTKQTLILFKI